MVSLKLQDETAICQYCVCLWSWNFEMATNKTL